MNIIIKLCTECTPQKDKYKIFSLVSIIKGVVSGQ